MNRLTNLLKAIALSPLIAALWLLQRILFWFAFRVVDVVLMLNPRDVEWMPRERLTEKQQQVNVSHQQMMQRIAVLIRQRG